MDPVDYCVFEFADSVRVAVNFGAAIVLLLNLHFPVITQCVALVRTYLKQSRLLPSEAV